MLSDVYTQRKVNATKKSCSILELHLRTKINSPVRVSLLLSPTCPLVVPELAIHTHGLRTAREVLTTIVPTLTFCVSRLWTDHTAAWPLPWSSSSPSPWLLLRVLSPPKLLLKSMTYVRSPHAVHTLGTRAARTHARTDGQTDRRTYGPSCLMYRFLLEISQSLELETELFTRTCSFEKESVELKREAELLESLTPST